ncbi:MAG TPA: hypothetical protein PKV27_03915 [Ilumatobacteraceae bacterium]|nr:hypothetical protein [Ilumatobacteraceae bacterium]
MGQQVAVTRLPSRPGVVRFETNRNFTGMGHESFSSLGDATGNRPVDVMARLLLDSGKVDAVHIYNNIVNVDVRKGYDDTGLDGLIANMYQYWTPGREIPSFDAPADEAPAAAAAGDTAGGAGPTAYEQLVPQSLRERSAAALARWKANH